MGGRGRRESLIYHKNKSRGGPAVMWMSFKLYSTASMLCYNVFQNYSRGPSQCKFVSRSPLRTMIPDLVKAATTSQHCTAILVVQCGL